MSPLLELGKVRPTMSWGERPLDMDVCSVEEYQHRGILHYLLMTNGHVTSSMSMDAEEHWVADGVMMMGTFYEFAPLNVFLN